MTGKQASLQLASQSQYIHERTMSPELKRVVVKLQEANMTTLVGAILAVLFFSMQALHSRRLTEHTAEIDLLRRGLAASIARIDSLEQRLTETTAKAENNAAENKALRQDLAAARGAASRTPGSSNQEDIGLLQPLLSCWMNPISGRDPFAGQGGSHANSSGGDGAHSNLFAISRSRNDGDEEDKVGKEEKEVRQKMSNDAQQLVAETVDAVVKRDLGQLLQVGATHLQPAVHHELNKLVRTTSATMKALTKDLTKRSCEFVGAFANNGLGVNAEAAHALTSGLEGLEEHLNSRIDERAEWLQSMGKRQIMSTVQR
eukprot:g4792.t1